MSKFHVKYITLFLLVVAYHLNSIAQSKHYAEIDSLKKVLKTEQDDSNKVKTLVSINGQFERIRNYDSSLAYSKKSVLLAEKISYKAGIAAGLSRLGDAYYAKGDFSKAIECQTKSLSISQEINNKRYMGWALLGLGVIYTVQGDLSKALQYDHRALFIEEQLGDSNSVATLQFYIGSAYSSSNNYPKALEYELKSLAWNEKMKDTGLIEPLFVNIGNVYSTLKNYQKGLEYYHKALMISKKLNDREGIAYEFFSIGNTYLHEETLDTALQCYLKSLGIARTTGDSSLVSSIYAGICETYCQQANYTETLEYYHKALQIAKEENHRVLICHLYSILGNAYTIKKEYPLAKVYLDSTLTLSKNINEKEHIKDAYAALSKLDSATGDYKKSLEDYKKYINYKDSLLNKEGITKIAQLEMSYSFEKTQDSVKATQEKADIIKAAEIHRKSIITYSATIIAILTAILAIVFINRQQIKRKKDIALSEKEKAFLKLEKQHAEDELVNAKIMLDEYLQSMEEKNKLLDEFKTDIEKLKSIHDKETDETRMKNLEYLNKATILTDEDWNKFKNLFEQVHKEFFKRLKEKLPDLTQAEMRLICLTKLSLSTKQMGGILGVSFNTIRTSRYRLRKKLGLAEEDRIDDIVESI